MLTSLLLMVQSAQTLEIPGIRWIQHNGHYGVFIPEHCFPVRGTQVPLPSTKPESPTRREGLYTPPSRRNLDVPTYPTPESTEKPSTVSLDPAFFQNLGIPATQVPTSPLPETPASPESSANPKKENETPASPTSPASPKVENKVVVASSPKQKPTPTPPKSVRDMSPQELAEKAKAQAEILRKEAAQKAERDAQWQAEHPDEETPTTPDVSSVDGHRIRTKSPQSPNGKGRPNKNKR